MSDYPVSLDTLDTDILGTDKQSTRWHADLHNQVNDAVNELEKVVWIVGSPDTSSHTYKIANLEGITTSLLVSQHSHTNMAALANVRNDLTSLHYLWGDGSYHTTHTHSNKTALDNINSAWLATDFLAEDWNYYPIHSHSNYSVLANIINWGPANEFLAADWNYYTIGGTGASWHDIEYDKVWLPVRSILNFYGAGVHVYDNAADDTIDIFIEWANQATGSAYIHHETFPNDDRYIDHELNTTDVIVACYDLNGDYLEFDYIDFTDSNHLHLHFTGDVCGKVVILTKGTSGSGGCCDDWLNWYTHSQIVASNSRSVNHNLETDDVIVMVYDTMWRYIEYDWLHLDDNNNLTITFTDGVVGKAVVLCERREACDTWTGWCTIQWNSTNIATDVRALNFIWAGVIDVSETSDIVTVNVSGWGGWGSDGVVNSASLAGNILHLGRTLALPDVTVDLSVLANTPTNGTYNHTQGVANTTWNVNHNLNSQVLTFRAYDSAGAWIEPDSVVIVDDDNITVTFSSAVDWSLAVIAAGWAGGSGEANTASNRGAGEGIFAGKVWVDLQLKSLVAWSGITLSSNANEITISAPSVPNAWNINSNSNATVTPVIGDFVIDNHSAADTNVNLPTAVGNDGLSIMVKKNNNGWFDTVVNWNGAELINGVNQLVITQDQSLVTLISDGANWHIGA